MLMIREVEPIERVVPFSKEINEKPPDCSQSPNFGNNRAALIRSLTDLRRFLVRICLFLANSRALRRRLQQKQTDAKLSRTRRGAEFINYERYKYEYIKANFFASVLLSANFRRGFGAGDDRQHRNHGQRPERRGRS
jgi:hypothetical protein